MRFLQHIFFCFFLFVSVNIAVAQKDSSFEYIATVTGNIAYFNVDNLDNIYFITNTNQLRKIAANGDSIAVFNDVKRFGIPAFIDVTNPLKILAYYKSFSTAVVLDRLLNNRNTINFRKQNIFTVKAIATSYDNNIWLFDEQDYKLKKIDDEAKVLIESNDCRMLFDTVPSPIKIIDQDNFVYVYDPEKGFYIFDYYGAFRNRLPFLQWSNVEVSGKIMYGFNDNKLYSYQLNSLALKEYKLPAFFGEYLAIKAMNGKIYLLKEHGIDIYKVK